MQKLLFALTATCLITFSASLQAANVTAGKLAYKNCISCHGALAEGALGPKLAGIDAYKIIEMLNKYRLGKHIGPMTSLMAPMAARLSDDDIANIAAYTEGL